MNDTKFRNFKVNFYLQEMKNNIHAFESFPNENAPILEITWNHKKASVEDDPFGFYAAAGDAAKYGKKFSGDDEKPRKEHFARTKELFNQIKGIVGGLGTISGSVAATIISYMFLTSVIPIFTTIAPYIIGTIVFLKYMDRDSTGYLDVGWRSVKDIFTGKKDPDFINNKQSFITMANSYMKFVESLPDQQKAFVLFKLEKLKQAIKVRNVRAIAKNLKELDAFLEENLSGEGNFSTARGSSSFHSFQRA